jgi:hypothetical protein
VKRFTRTLMGLGMGACCIVMLGSQVAYAQPVDPAGLSAATQRSLPRVPIEVYRAKAISPGECSGLNWVYVSVKVGVPQRYIRAEVSNRIYQSWTLPFEVGESRTKFLGINVLGSCDTIYRMLLDGVDRVRATFFVSAPGYRDTKLTVEIPVRF